MGQPPHPVVLPLQCPPGQPAVKGEGGSGGPRDAQGGDIQSAQRGHCRPRSEAAGEGWSRAPGAPLQGCLEAADGASHWTGPAMGPQPCSLRPGPPARSSVSAWGGPCASSRAGVCGQGRWPSEGPGGGPWAPGPAGGAQVDPPGSSRQPPPEPGRPGPRPAGPASPRGWHPGCGAPAAGKSHRGTVAAGRCQARPQGRQLWGLVGAHPQEGAPRRSRLKPEREVVSVISCQDIPSPESLQLACLSPCPLREGRVLVTQAGRCGRLPLKFTGEIDHRPGLHGNQAGLGQRPPHLLGKGLVGQLILLWRVSRQGLEKPPGGKATGSV